MKDGKAGVIFVIEADVAADRISDRKKDALLRGLTTWATEDRSVVLELPPGYRLRGMVRAEDDLEGLPEISVRIEETAVVTMVETTFDQSITPGRGLDLRGEKTGDDK